MAKVKDEALREFKRENPDSFAHFPAVQERELWAKADAMYEAVYQRELKKVDEEFRQKAIWGKLELLNYLWKFPIEFLLFDKDGTWFFRRCDGSQWGGGRLSFSFGRKLL